MNATPLVVKIGGAALAEPNTLVRLLEALAVACNQRPWLLVHGGGAMVDQWLAQAGYATEKKDGQRITPAEQIPLISGALAGYSNLQFVQLAQHAQLQAVGLTLADAGGVPLTVEPELGAVASPNWRGLTQAQGYKNLLSHLWGAGYTPVVSSIGAVDHQLVNVNADLAAAALASLCQAELLLLSDVPAILDDQANPIHSLPLSAADTYLANDTIQGGMRVKLLAAIEAARLSRRSTAITSWQHADAVVALLNGDTVGTRITF